MKLYPQDLRDRQHAVIVRRRAYGVYGKANPSDYAGLAADPPPPRPMGRLGRFWRRGTALTEREMATGLPAASMSVGPAQWAGTSLTAVLLVLAAAIAGTEPTPLHVETLGGAAALWGAVSGLSMTVFPRQALLGLYRKPLSASELDALLSDADEEVDRAYLTLLRECVLQDVPDEAQTGLREALRALGRAVDSLPSSVPPLQDTAVLRQQADGLTARARAESDAVIAASLERQADALFRRAAAGERNARVMQRAQILRQEVLAQIAALRAGLSEFSTEGAGPANAGLLAALSEDARRVADAAESVALARVELETYLTAPGSGTLQEGAVIKAGRD